MTLKIISKVYSAYVCIFSNIALLKAHYLILPFFITYLMINNNTILKLSNKKISTLIWRVFTSIIFSYFSNFVFIHKYLRTSLIFNFIYNMSIQYK